MLRYLRFLKLCDFAFVFFMVAWLVTRHILFNLIISSLIFESPIHIPFAWDPAREYYYTRDVYRGFIAMLVSLQVSPGDTFFSRTRA